MNMKQLQYVITLAREGSFSKAAEKLGISQPSLSQYIKKTENEVGMQLFDRSGSDIRLTDAGEIYIEAGRKILDLEHQMEQKFSDLGNYKGGTVKVGISPYRSVHMIPKVFGEFNKLYPDTKLVIVEKSGNDLINAAEHGEFDICIIARPVESDMFKEEIIAYEEILLAVNKKTKLYKKLLKNSKEVASRKYPVVDIKYIDGEDFAILNEFSPMNELAKKILSENRITIHEKVEVSSNDALCSIVRSGVCAALISSGVADSDSEDVKYFSLKQNLKIRDIVAIYRKGQYLSKPAKDLIKIFKKVNM